MKPWYEVNGCKLFDNAASNTKAIDMYDRPTNGDPWTIPVGGAQYHLAKTEGLDSFRTWLVARHEDTGAFIYLNYLDWSVNYGTTVAFDKANPANSTVTPAPQAGGKLGQSYDAGGWLYWPNLEDRVPPTTDWSRWTAPGRGLSC